MVLLWLLVCEVGEKNFQVASVNGVGKVADLPLTIIIALTRVYSGEVLVKPKHTFSWLEQLIG